MMSRQPDTPTSSLVGLYTQAAALMEQLTHAMIAAGLLPATGAPLWDTQDVKRLLFRPQQLLTNPSRAAWITGRGGLQEVYRWLQTLPLRPSQREVFQLQLEYPGQPRTQIRLLCISTAAYYERRRHLIEAVQTFLNGGTL